jgi:hypothetical protein
MGSMNKNNTNEICMQQLLHAVAGVRMRDNMLVMTTLERKTAVNQHRLLTSDARGD